MASLACDHRSSPPLDRSSSTSAAAHSSASRSAFSRSWRSISAISSGLTLRPAISRRASTVGLSLLDVDQRLDALGQLAGALGRHQHQFEAVVDDFQAVFHGNACHKTLKIDVNSRIYTKIIVAGGMVQCKQATAAGSIWQLALNGRALRLAALIQGDAHQAEHLVDGGHPVLQKPPYLL